MEFHYLNKSTYFITKTCISVVIFDIIQVFFLFLFFFEISKQKWIITVADPGFPAGGAWTRWGGAWTSDAGAFCRKLM